jgi:hypothetical protein
VAVAKGYDSFADAILRKLVQEVAGAPPARDAAALAKCSKCAAAESR